MCLNTLDCIQPYLTFLIPRLWVGLFMKSLRLFSLMAITLFSFNQQASADWRQDAGCTGSSTSSSSQEDGFTITKNFVCDHWRVEIDVHSSKTIECHFNGDRSFTVGPYSEDTWYDSSKKRNLSGGCQIVSEPPIINNKGNYQEEQQLIDGKKMVRLRGRYNGYYVCAFLNGNDEIHRQEISNKNPTKWINMSDINRLGCSKFD